MPLTIYRRHSRDCKVHVKVPTAKAKRHFTDCDCLIWICGETDTQKFPRQALRVKDKTGRLVKIRDWAAAEAYVRSLAAKNKDTAVHGPTVSDCVTAFL